MKKSLLTALNFSLGILGVSAIAGATAITLTSCTQNTSGYDKSITKQLNAQYNSELSVALGNKAYYQLTKENQPKVVSVINKYLDQVNNIIAETENSFKLDESIWLRAFQYELQTKKKLVESNIRYIIVNSYDQMIMTNYSKSFQNTIKKVAGQWMNGSNPVSANDRINQLTAIDTYITDIHNNLQEGLEVGTTWSGVLAKHTIGSMLQMLYDAELQQMAFPSANGMTVTNLNEASLKGTLFTNNTNYATWKTSSTEDANAKKSIDELVNKTQNDLDSLMNFLLGDYFKGIKYGRPTSISEGKSINFTVVDQSPNEEDNGFSAKSGSATKYIKGLGLDKTDLETKDIGIGFSGPTGQAIYKALLQKHSNVIDADPSQQYKFGADQVEGILNAMKQVANKIADLKGNGTNKEWKETYMYDQDSSGNTYGSEKQQDVVIRSASGQVTMPKFFQWLNSDQFFNGRDMDRSTQYPTIDGTTNIFPKQQEKPNQLDNSVDRTSADNGNTANGGAGSNGGSNSSGSDVGTKLTITKKTPYKYKSYYVGNDDLVASVIGYVGDTDADVTKTNGEAGNLYVKYIIDKLSPATIQTSDTITNDTMDNSISPEAAYIGASRAVYQYLVYKANVSDHIASAFKVTPHNWTLRSGVGGAAYASEGLGAAEWVNKGWGGFYLDVNPYFGLQKWSMSTLTNHEAVSGHVFQFDYASANPADADAVSFSSTAYAEGWGLFSEWFATQLGVYGEPTQASGLFTKDSNGVETFTQQDVLTLPKFGTNSKTVDVSQLSSDYANGVYGLPVKQNKAGETPTEPEKKNNQTYYDALQYFGFLNERQLRAMRIPVDVGIHAGTDGTFKKGSGYSLQEARNYLTSNSGLGVDDIKRETKRYLEYTAQATSYYNGLNEMQSYFLKAKTLFEKNNSGATFMDWNEPVNTKNNTQDLFDLILRNNDVPMPVLSWAVDKYLNQKYPNKLDLNNKNI